MSDRMTYLLSHFTLFSISMPVCGSRLSVGRFITQSPRTRKERAIFVVAEAMAWLRAFSFLSTTSSQRRTALHECQVQLGRGIDKTVVAWHRLRRREHDTLAILVRTTRMGMRALRQNRESTINGAVVQYYTIHSMLLWHRSDELALETRHPEPYQQYY